MSPRRNQSGMRNNIAGMFNSLTGGFLDTRDEMFSEEANSRRTRQRATRSEHHTSSTPMAQQRADLEFAKRLLEEDTELHEQEHIRSKRRSKFETESFSPNNRNSSSKRGESTDQGSFRTTTSARSSTGRKSSSTICLANSDSDTDEGTPQQTSSSTGAYGFNHNRHNNDAQNNGYKMNDGSETQVGFEMDFDGSESTSTTTKTNTISVSNQHRKRTDFQSFNGSKSVRSSNGGNAQSKSNMRTAAGTTTTKMTVPKLKNTQISQGPRRESSRTPSAPQGTSIESTAFSHASLKRDQPSSSAVVYVARTNRQRRVQGNDGSVPQNGRHKPVSLDSGISSFALKKLNIGDTPGNRRKRRKGNPIQPGAARQKSIDKEAKQRMEREQAGRRGIEDVRIARKTNTASSAWAPNEEVLPRLSPVETRRPREKDFGTRRRTRSASKRMASPEIVEINSSESEDDDDDSESSLPLKRFYWRIDSGEWKDRNARSTYAMTFCEEEKKMILTMGASLRSKTVTLNLSSDNVDRVTYVDEENLPNFKAVPNTESDRFSSDEGYDHAGKIFLWLSTVPLDLDENDLCLRITNDRTCLIVIDFVHSHHVHRLKDSLEASGLVCSLESAEGVKQHYNERNIKPQKNRQTIAKKRKRNQEDVVLNYPFPGYREAVLDESICSDLGEVFKLINIKSANESRKKPSVDTGQSRQRADHIVVRFRDYQRLKNRRWLNDTLVDFFMQWLTRGQEDIHRSDIHIFTSHFYSTLRDEGEQSVESWTKKKGIDIFKKKLVFLPINESLHWSLCVLVNPGYVRQQQKDNAPRSMYPCILFMDSLKLHDSSHVQKNVYKWLNQEWARLKGQTPRRVFTGKTFPCHSPEVPRQKNGCDCGVFVCRYAYGVYQLSGLELTNSTVLGTSNRPFEDLIEQSVNFSFGAEEIQHIRTDFQTLIIRLEDLSSQPAVKLENSKNGITDQDAPINHEPDGDDIDARTTAQSEEFSVVEIDKKSNQTSGQSMNCSLSESVLPKDSLNKIPNTRCSDSVESFHGEINEFREAAKMPAAPSRKSVDCDGSESVPPKNYFDEVVNSRCCESVDCESSHQEVTEDHEEAKMAAAPNQESVGCDASGSASMSERIRKASLKEFERTDTNHQQYNYDYEDAKMPAVPDQNENDQEQQPDDMNDAADTQQQQQQPNDINDAAGDSERDSAEYSDNVYRRRSSRYAFAVDL